MDHTYKEMVLKGTVLRCSGYDPKCKGNGRELDCSINKKRFLLARNSIISCAGQTKLKKVPTKRGFLILPMVWNKRTEFFLIF